MKQEFNPEAILLWGAKLSQHHREVLMLSSQLWSMERIAFRLQIPVGTVKSRLYRARNRLRTIIKGEGNA